MKGRIGLKRLPASRREKQIARATVLGEWDRWRARHPQIPPPLANAGSTGGLPGMAPVEGEPAMQVMRTGCATLAFAGGQLVVWGPGLGERVEVACLEAMSHSGR